MGSKTETAPLKLVVMTTVVPRRGGKLLLGMKKVRFGKGKWNGFGGKVEGGETIAASAVRELREESGLTAARVTEWGRIKFHLAEHRDKILDVHFLEATGLSGKIQESNEMVPRWFSEDEIPYDTMWPDDRYWLPAMLRGNRFSGEFWFRADGGIDKHVFNEATQTA
jgi:8-oxo-dGTP pyrophosphatase MutT (NUDIX family)